MKPGIYEYYDYVIKEGDKVIKKSGKRRCHSFLKQFAQFMLVQTGFISLSMKDITNTSRTILSLYGSGGYYWWRGLTIAAAGATTYGLVVGSNDTAVTINDYGLNTLIAHGVSAGQLQYSAQIAGAPTWDSTTNYFTYTRVFTNASGGNVSINEIGLYVLGSPTTTNTFCFMRDVLAATITLTNGQNLTLNYTIKATL